MNPNVEPGTRIRLIEMTQDPEPIAPGSTGTVYRVMHSIGQIAVKWDNGRTLDVITDIDRFELE